MKLKSDNIYTSGIEYFFNPKSIAIVGASKNLTKFGGRPISALLKKKYTGTVYPINGRYKEIAGLTCYPSVHDVPGEIDFAIISVPIERTLEALQQCAEKGVKAAVVFTSGFAET
ncbi:MAG TPA: CoA-binding protein, partial [Smithellaceae bacterium]|nr:CoA-binding protein [Smithellaceae bacterium]